MKLTDPYSTYPKDGLNIQDRIAVRLPRCERDFIVGIRPVRGTIQTIINLYIKNIIDECRRRGITDYSRREDFERLVIERTTISGPHPEPAITRPVVGRRHPEVYRTPEDKSDINPNLPSGGGKEGGKATKGGKRGKS